MGDARHRVRVEHLEEKRANTAHEHRGKVGVHESGHAVDAKIGSIRVDATRRRVLRESDGAANVALARVRIRAGTSFQLIMLTVPFLSIPAYGFGLSTTTVTCDTRDVTSV